MDRRVEPVETLDWYDGIVTGVVRLSWTDGVFLASLLAWSQRRRRRALALLRLDAPEADAIQRLSTGDWSKLVDHLRDLCERATGEVIVAEIDESTDTVLTAATVPLTEAREHLIADVERTLEPDRMRWLSPET